MKYGFFFLFSHKHKNSKLGFFGKKIGNLNNWKNKYKWKVDSVYNFYNAFCK